jgi:hypothetical protein
MRLRLRGTTNVVERTERARGRIAGRPYRFVSGHISDCCGGPPDACDATKGDRRPVDRDDSDVSVFVSRQLRKGA